MTLPSLLTRLRWIPILCLLSVSTLVFADDSLPVELAEPAPAEVAPADELWMISTRCLGYPGACTEPNLQVHRHDGCCWESASIEEFMAGGDPSQITVIYIHGNRIESNEVHATGTRFFSALRRGGEPRPALRQVIWSWPSDQVRGPVRDARVKGQRAHAEAYYLAWLLDRLPPEQRVSLVGYSFGSRAILGALHMTAGGQVCGRSLCRSEGAVAPLQPVRAAVMAAAAHCHWLQPQSTYGLAMSRIDQLLVYYNNNDPALQYYRFLDHSQAMGYVGVCGLGCLGSDAAKVRQWNTCPAVGRTHDVNAYFASEEIMRRVRTYAFWLPVE